MKKLKMIEISNVDNLCNDLEWHGDPSNFMLSNELCVMDWWGYPFESLPTRFQSDNLVELTMRYSCIKQLWDGMKVRVWLIQMYFLLLLPPPFTLVHFIYFI
jgi:hypothetical protein